MKIAIVNGSARKGNTLAAIQAMLEGIGDKHEVEMIQADKLQMAPCMGCNACQCYKGCVAKDDTNETVDKLAAADMIVFATPVYWWGMSAQLKLVIDKMYCKGAELKGKKIGTIIVGGSPIDNIQYSLIKDQFKCMAEYLDWNILFQKAYFACSKDELKGNRTAMEEMAALGKEI